MSHDDTSPASAGPELQISMALEYAQAARDSLDFYNRMCMGQIEELEWLVRTGVIPVYTQRDQPRQGASMEVCDQIRGKLMEIKALLGYPSNGSMGVGNPHMNKGGLCVYELEKVIDKALAYHRNPKPEFKGVNYDGLTVRYTNLPAPTAKIVGNAPAPKSEQKT